ncbi:hypothetical protein [Leptospira noguchii]|nr:hypothetical protein [Leptospira noguchii]
MKFASDSPQFSYVELTLFSVNSNNNERKWIVAKIPEELVCVML